MTAVLSAEISAEPVSAGQPLFLSDLVELVRDIAADISSWQDQLVHLPDRRWWTRLLGDDQVDVWLISWPGGGSTDLHDHGGSSAAFTVVEGVLDEVRAVDASGALSADSLPAGQIRWVAPGVVHDVRNTQGVRAASIHAYSPPLEQMTYYRTGPAGLEVTHILRGDQPETEESW